MILALSAPLVLFQNCASPRSAINASMGGVGSDGMTVAAYNSTTLNALNVCIGRLVFTPSDPNAPVIQLNYNPQQETSIPSEGANLQALTLPQGSFAEVQIELSDACGTQRSIGIVNSQGTFNSNQTVTLTFTGPIVINTPHVLMTFSVQAIVDNLGQATSNADVSAQATAAPGTAKLGDLWLGSPSAIGAPSARNHAMSVWTGSKMIVWGGLNDTGTNTNLSFNSGGIYDPASDSWSPTSTGANVPSSRGESVAAWTGSEMIIWGGTGAASGLHGARYNPATDTWTAMSTTQEPAWRYSAASVWTGTELLVWGGYDNNNVLNTGGRYNPTTDTWTALPTVGAPPAAWFFGQPITAVWTGTEMLVWGGEHTSSLFTNTGGRYNPTTNSWSPISTTGAPTARVDFTPIWTGTEMIVWGGYDGPSFNTGARYNPTTDTWTAMSTVNAPRVRDSYCAAWNGSKMVIWGGNDGNTALNDGASYDPLTDTWTSISSVTGFAARYDATTVWTGSHMIIWGGATWQGTFFGDGAIYAP